jgi:lipopolysaccharide export system permease protein
VRWRHVTLLDRYIFRSALFSCIAAVSLFGFVVMSVNVIRDLIGPVLAGQFSNVEAIRLVLLLVPFVISYALPMGMLTGILLTLGRLSADNEVTAMRAAGLSLTRIALPIFLLGFAGAAIGLPINFKAMPWARVEYDHEFNQAIRAKPLSFIVPKTFSHNFPGWVVYVNERKGSELRDIWVWKLDDMKRATSLWHSAAGHVDYDEQTSELILTLLGGQAETLNEKHPEEYSMAGAVPTIGSFDQWSPRLSLAALFQRQGDRRKLQWMTYPQLKEERERRIALPIPLGGAPEHARAVMQVSFTIMDKFNTALAVLSFAVLGVPLGIKVSRRETSANLGLAVGLAVSYYFLTVMIGWLDRHPEYRPDLLLWVPNLAFLTIGLILFSRIDRN